MSLISEALRKARLEAARHDAARRGEPVPAVATPAAPRTPLLLLTAGALALTVAALFFLIGRMSAEAPPPATSTPVAAGTASTSAPGPGAAVEPAADDAAPRPSEGGVPPRPAVSDPRGAQRAAEAPRRTAAAPDPAPAAADDPPPAAPARAAPAEPVPAAPAAPPQARVHTGSAPLGDGSRLELSGIAWSRTSPSALINGRIVGRGERVAGHLLVDIRPREVELEGEGGRLILRLE